MKVAFLMGSLNRGGTETLILDVLRNATGNGLDAICIYRKGGALEEEFLRCDVPIIKINTGKNPALYLKRLRKELLNQKTDVVHAQQAIDALYARAATISTGIKVVVTMHGYDYTESKTGKWILGLSLKFANRVFYVSEAQRNYYLQQYMPAATTKHVVVYNGISLSKLDMPDAHSKQPSTSLCTELGISEPAYLLGSVGNFNFVRDQMTICRFLSLLNKKGIDFQFVFAGKRIDSLPFLYEDCVSYCEKEDILSRVHFLGGRNDVPHILKQLDAFVYSTDHDTFGIAVVEAMYAGCKVFANDWEVMTEILSQIGSGIHIYQSKNPEDLLQVFLKFIEQETNKVQIKEMIQQKFSISGHIEQLKKEYQRA
jgi:glycosyltransferase involved in cell wall biosynthesis